MLVPRVVGGQVEVSGKQPWQREGLGARGFTLAPPSSPATCIRRWWSRGTTGLAPVSPPLVPGYAGCERATREGRRSTASTYPHVGRLGLRVGLQNLAYQVQATSALLGHTFSWPTAHSRGKEMR